MKYIILFTSLLLISCDQSKKTEKDFLKFSELLVTKLKNKKLENLDKMFYDIDVIKTINNTSDSLGFKNEVERKIFHSRYNYTRHASEYLKNISRKLTGEIKITNYYFKNNNFHVIVCSEISDKIEGTELILTEKNNKIVIDNYYSFTTGLNIKKNYIENAIYELNDRTLMDSNEMLKQSLNLYNSGLNHQAYELIKQIPYEHSSLHNFLAAKYKIMRSTIRDLNPEEVDEIYSELISNNFDNKGFRYNYTIEYLKVFGQDSLANIYKDSLFGIIKDQYFIKKLK
jgi:hypothetical protein